MSWVKSLFGFHKAALNIHEQYKSFTVNGELYVPDKKTHEKTCLFIDCNLSFVLGDSPSSYTVKIVNLLYDPDQTNMEELSIRITPSLRFEKYKGRNVDDEEVRGFCFYEKGTCYLFQLLPGKEQKASDLECYMTQLLFEVKTGKPSKAVPKENLNKLCP
eukprot:TRINITY_DN3244_c0_g1_i12.p3 TRINITY_DN3244_c0_g1~~TRINITY_DN3244_c0_g1_i12.p3  ORF type:complete len:160 (+),score=49.12 TRINITY_DN3244_c0_g1_i12:149-628(+)